MGKIGAPTNSGGNMIYRLFIPKEVFFYNVRNTRWRDVEIKTWEKFLRGELKELHPREEPYDLTAAFVEGMYNLYKVKPREDGKGVVTIASMTYGERSGLLVPLHVVEERELILPDDRETLVITTQNSLGTFKSVDALFHSEDTLDDDFRISISLN